MDSLSFSLEARERIRAAGAVFGDEATLTFEGIEGAPNGPGVLVLVCRDVTHGPWFAWTEGCDDVRARLRQLTSYPERLHGELGALLAEPDRLRFRAARLPDRERAARLAGLLSSEVRRTRPRPNLGFVC